MIGKFVSTTRMSKQGSRTSFIYRPPANTTTLLHDRGHLELPVPACRCVYASSSQLHAAACNACLVSREEIAFRVVSFCNLIGASKTCAAIVDRNYTEVLPGPFSIFRMGPGNEASVDRHPESGCWPGCESMNIINSNHKDRCCS